jgi:cholesterol transport system auxiliary component
MTMRRHFIHLAAACAVLVAVAGCTRPPPIKGLFVLEPASPPAAAKAQPGLLRIGSVTAASPYRSRQFVVRESDLKYETDYYNEFLVAPASNIGEATARALSAAHVFTSVAPSTVTIDPDWVLDAFVGAMYGDARATDKPAAVLSITFFLRRQAGDAGVPVWSKTYERRVAFATGSASAYVAALNTGFGDILADLATDLSALNLATR